MKTNPLGKKIYPKKKENFHCVFCTTEGLKNLNPVKQGLRQEKYGDNAAQ